MYIELEGKIHISAVFYIYFFRYWDKLLTKSQVFKPLYSGCNLLPMSNGSWNEAIKDKL